MLGYDDVTDAASGPMENQDVVARRESGKHRIFVDGEALDREEFRKFHLKGRLNQECG